MKVITIDLFSGIGGFAEASEELGWETAIMCEIDPMCRIVLAHHFPNAYIHDDIHTLTWEIINEEITKRFGKHWRDSYRLLAIGGFPCPSFSNAGKRKGREDDRYLWPEMLRIIQVCRPDAVVGENVLGIVSIEGGLVFESVQTDLEAQGFEVQAVVVPACAVGAPHRRDRVWFVANRDRPDRDTDLGGFDEKQGKEILGKEQSPDPTGVGNEDERSFAHPDSGGGVRVAGKKITASSVNKSTLKMAGNAIVPQIAIEIFRALQDTWND